MKGVLRPDYTPPRRLPIFLPPINSADTLTHNRVSLRKLVICMFDAWNIHGRVWECASH